MKIKINNKNKIFLSLFSFKDIVKQNRTKDVFSKWR